MTTVTKYKVEKALNMADRWEQRLLMKDIIKSLTKQVKELEDGMLEDGTAYKKLVRIDSVKAHSRKITEFCKMDDAVEAIKAEVE